MKITEIETLPVSVDQGHECAVIILPGHTEERPTDVGEASLAAACGRGELGILAGFTERSVGQTS